MENIESFHHMGKDCSYLSEIEDDHFLSELGTEVVIAAKGKLNHLLNVVILILYHNHNDSMTIAVDR